MPDDANGGSSVVTQPAGAAGKKTSDEEIAALKAILANQQKQIEELRRTLESQQRMLDRSTGDNSNKYAEAPLAPRPQQSLGEVASTTPIIPGSGRSAMGSPVIPAQPPQKDQPESYPTQLRLGNITIMPVGFADFTSAWRSTNPGSGIGSNFGSIPFLNTTAGRLSEFRVSDQNSRLGVRIDGDLKGTHVLGYWESDFLGTPTSNNFTITNHANLFRLRLFWVDLKKDKWELLGGQSWSLLTPGRSGISPLPGDIFFSQDIDVNYQLGLVWSRTPGLRVVYHPNSSWALAFALEDPEGSIGGSGGGGAVTLPVGTGATSIATLYAPQLDAGGAQLTVPNVMPDFEGKIAYDFKKKFHFEIAGVARRFKAYNINNNNHYYATGVGGEVNLNAELFPGFRFLSNNYWSDGGGRYIFGLAPDVIVRGDGSLSPVHAGSTIQGFEYTHKNTLLYSYYGGVYIGKNVAIDPKTNAPVGYGFTGSPNSHNRAMNEVTFGFNQTFWKDPKYGAINLMGQYSWLSRNPWFVAPGQPDDTHLSMLYFNLRYTLPGSAPTMGK
jgi:hypothetical protein